MSTKRCTLHPKRDVRNRPRCDPIATLDAQLAAAVVRASELCLSRIRALRAEHSALAFASPLGAIHSLSTGAANLYRIASFELLYV